MKGAKKKSAVQTFLLSLSFSSRSRSEVLSRGFDNRSFLLGFEDSDNIRKSLLRTVTTSRVAVQHNLDLDTQDTLTQVNVTNGSGDEFTGRVTRVNHETVRELHGLGTGSTDLTRDNDFTTLGTRFHNETNDTITGTKKQSTFCKYRATLQSLTDGQPNR